MIDIYSYEVYCETIKAFEALWYTSMSDWEMDFFDDDWVSLYIDMVDKTYNTISK